MHCRLLMIKVVGPQTKYHNKDETGLKAPGMTLVPSYRYGVGCIYEWRSDSRNKKECFFNAKNPQLYVHTYILIQVVTDEINRSDDFVVLLLRPRHQVCISI